MDNRAFYSVFISFFSGVFIASFIHIGAIFFFIVFIVVACLLVKRRKSALYLVCIVFFAFGAYRLEISRTNIHNLDNRVGEIITLYGFISEEPEAKNISRNFHFKPDNSRDKIIVSTSLYPEYKYGDALKITGTLKFPENFESYPGGPEFDYISYLSKDDVRYVVVRPKIYSLGENHGNIIVSVLIKIKGAFMGNIERLMLEPHSSLVAGILLGEKSALPLQLKDDFRRSGLTHILVLSGSNVSIVASSLMNIFSFLPRAFGQSLGALSVILFAIMTGAGATTIRASIMALIIIMSRRVGRNYNVSRALIIAGFLMLIQNPRIMVFDIGFQLSFLSTLALIYVSPTVIEKLEWVTEKCQLRDILATTISTQIFIIPFMLYSMGEVSVISLITNLLVLPLVPWSMFTGFMTGFLGFFGPYIALPVAWITDIILSWMILVVSFFGELPFASIKLLIGKPVLVFIYTFYIWLIFRWHRKNSFLPSAN